jgi:cytochrome P450
VSELTKSLMREGVPSGERFEMYRRLRDEEPVAWDEELGYWAVSRHADVLAVSRDPATFCSSKGILTFEIGVDYASPPTMMHTDPPAHTAYRKLVQPGFKPSLMRALEDDVRRRVTVLFDAIEPGAVTDVVDALAVPLPLQVIASLLGVPEDDLDRLYDWSEAAIPGSNDWSEEHRQALLAEMHEYLLAATGARREDPRNDIVSIVAAEGLNDLEVVMFLNQLLVAGNETTRHAMTGAIVALAERPDQWATLVSEPATVSTAVEEVLRWTTPVMYFMRTATCDTELGGQAIAAGQPIVMLYASANRDEAHFGPTAGDFNVTRTPNEHVALGFGAHFCLGAALARLELRVLLEELRTRFTGLRPAGEVEETGSNIIAGIRRAPVVFS